MTALAKTAAIVKKKTGPSSPQRGRYITTITARDQLGKKISGRKSQGGCRQDELIGGKPPVVKQL
jgi:hypothetical protein